MSHPSRHADTQTHSHTEERTLDAGEQLASGATCVVHRHDGLLDHGLAHHLRQLGFTHCARE
jgi:hypothetical protein